ncbi:MAG: hypothetical protein J7M38_10875, partial [Armatimonadetes bacterium]|nr:hypothetical protein [Armatimonadota bacterium]
MTGGIPRPGNKPPREVMTMRLTDRQMAEILSRHDMIWDAPPVEWLDGIPLANGRITAMIRVDGVEAQIPSNYL